jgi:hypothetical protein
MFMRHQFLCATMVEWVHNFTRNWLYYGAKGLLGGPLSQLLSLLIYDLFEIEHIFI